MELNTPKTRKTMFLIFFAILTWWLFDNFRLVGLVGGFLFDVFLPFIVALAIAFVVNKPMSYIEKKLFEEYGFLENIKLKYRRMISLFLTLAIVGILVTLFSMIVVPNLVEAVKTLSEQVPAYLDNFQTYIETNSIGNLRMNEWVKNLNLENLTKNATNFIKGGFTNVVGTTVGIFSSAFGFLTSFFLGIVFSFYFLIQKEELTYSIKKLVFAVFPLHVANKLIYLSRLTKESFSSFITGQSIEAVLIGAIFFVSMLVFNFPYALMVSIIIGISALIPIVGAFIGLVIGAFLIFVQDPQKALYFILLFIVIQQLEGDLIYPKVVGKASGLSSVWILAAVTIGGSLFGIIGIILFVPMFSVIQTLLTDYIESRLEYKGLKGWEASEETRS